MAAAVALTLVTGCSGISDLQFRVDKRLHFVSPANRSLVTVPVHLAWTMADFEVVPLGSGEPSRHAGFFGIFVDRAPIKPSQSLQTLVNDGTRCDGRTDCPSASYLADRNVYLTTDSSFTLTQLPILAGKEKVQLHTVVVVLLDASGRRIGESAFQIQFKARRRGLQ